MNSGVKKIVIVEDDNLLYTAMKIFLEGRLKSSGIAADITRFDALAPAYHFLNQEKVDVISTDMGFPDFSGNPVVERLMGIRLIRLLGEKEIDTPVVVYSGNEKRVIADELKRLEVDFPEENIFVKNHEGNEGWMQAIINILKTK